MGSSPPDIFGLDLNARDAKLGSTTIGNNGPADLEETDDFPEFPGTYKIPKFPKASKFSVEDICKLPKLSRTHNVRPAAAERTEKKTTTAMRELISLVKTAQASGHVKILRRQSTDTVRISDGAQLNLA
mmetsp:Transcript_32743/g.77186  ORF Transcript_32743/g.77186 Transcript_32743/m.77186 type:complete len:129 (-) Transcript_32743:18-404(-)